MATFPDFELSVFEGNNTEVQDIKTLKPSLSPDSVNWITAPEKDSISLRRGVALLGATDAGAGRVTGLGVGKGADGKEIPFWTHGRKLKYFDADSGDAVEIGSDILPVAQDGEDASIVAYENLAGAFAYVSSPWMQALKIAMANPGTAIDQLNQTYRGYIGVHQSRTFLWQRNSIKSERDLTNLYLSWIDKQLYTDYTGVTKEDVGNGDGSTKNFPSIALAQRTGTRTVFLVSIAAPVNAGTAISGYGILQAPLAVVHAPGHSLVAGDPIMIRGVVGMTEINNLIGYVVSVGGSDVQISIDSSGFAAYVSGGTIYKAEVLKDNKNGGLLSAEGGTGTVNYSTGAVNATFFAAPTNGTDIIAEYFYEDATSEGIWDFTIQYDTGVRVPASGDVMPQYGGGNLNSVAPLANSFYNYHSRKTWQVSIPTDDGSEGRVNLPYREIMATPTPWSVFPGAKGVYFLDLANPNKPAVRRLEEFAGGVQATNMVVPKLLSEALNLALQAFDYCVVYEWGDLVLMACQRVSNGTADAFNSVTYLLNTKSGTWDKLKLFGNRFATYNGALLYGDSISNNVYIAFSGFSDEDSPIENYWTSADLGLNWEGQKKLHRMVIDGLIQGDQNLDVYLSFDDGPFVKYFTVEGTGSYVNVGQQTSIGSYTLGSFSVGQGGDAFANPFWVEFPINSDRFEYVRLKLVANNVGYAQVNKVIFKDIRPKARKSMPVRLAS